MKFTVSESLPSTREGNRSHPRHSRSEKLPARRNLYLWSTVSPAYLDNAGFESDKDFGVPYIKDISFTGYQTEFNRNAGESFGRSGSNHTTQIIAGNTFDFPAIHGESIADAGFGFVSASVGAVESGNVKLSNYKNVDLILGKQKAGIIGNGKSGLKFRTFSPELEHQLRLFSDGGGNLLVSGENIVSA